MNLIDIAKGIGVLIIIAVALGASLVSKATSETVTPLTNLNPASSGPKALIIYHPGVSDFQQKITESFVEGLVSSGWNVSITTASIQATIELSGYNLIVLGSPIYGGQPEKSIKDYIARLDDFEGKRVYMLLTGAGEGVVAEKTLKQLAETSNAGGIDGLTLFTMTRNTPFQGSSDAREIAYQVAQSLQK